jgi:hypothetical protein
MTTSLEPRLQESPAHSPARRVSQGNELTPVRSSLERFFFAWFFVLIPAVYALRLAVEYADSRALPYALQDRVKIASELALLVIFTLANTLLATVRPVISSLFSNGVVSKHKAGESELAETQATCEQSIDRLLNHGARMVGASIVAFATFCYYVARMGGLVALVPTGSVLTVLDVLLYFLPTLCYAYFVGIVAWKLCVTSWFFQSFPERYSVAPRFLHPDGACGLVPVGDLCVTMMYVAVIPTALSALFLLAHFAPQGFAAYLTPNDTLLFGFTPAILGVGALGLIMGFLPLFRFHLAIIKHRDEWTQELKGLAERIIAEKARIFRPPEGVGEPPIDAVLKTVTELQLHYEASRKVRMWPVDGGLVARIWGSVVLVSGQLLAFIETVRKLS